MASAMRRITRREFLGSASAATTLGTIAAPGILRAARTTLTQRVFIGSHAPDGILAYDWDPASATLTPSGVAAKVPNVAWLALSRGFVYSASELETFEGKPTGEVGNKSLMLSRWDAGQPSWYRIGPPAIPDQARGCLDKLTVKTVIPLFATSHKRPEARVAPAAECASFQRLVLRRNIPFHFWIGETGGPLFAGQDNVFQPIEELRRCLSKILRVVFR